MQARTSLRCDQLMKPQDHATKTNLDTTSDGPDCDFTVTNSTKGHIRKSALIRNARKIFLFFFGLNLTFFFWADLRTINVIQNWLHFGNLGRFLERKSFQNLKRICFSELYQIFNHSFWNETHSFNSKSYSLYEFL